jgi:hypothetical protein
MQGLQVIHHVQVQVHVTVPVMRTSKSHNGTEHRSPCVGFTIRESQPGRLALRSIQQQRASWSVIPWCPSLTKSTSIGTASLQRLMQ